GTGRAVLASLSDLATFFGLDELPRLSPSHDHRHELFKNNTPSSATTLGSGIEITVNGMGGFEAGEHSTASGGESQGLNEFAWMDQIVKMAYGEFRST